MNRLLRIVAAFFTSALILPAPALAASNQFTPLALHLVVSATGLAVAVVLLAEALMLRKVAYGGAVAEKLHFVVLAIVCLASSALAKWTSNFVTGVTFEQTELASELLVLIGMALLAGYFYSVRMAMQAFLNTMKSERTSQDQAVAGESEAKSGG